MKGRKRHHTPVFPSRLLWSKPQGFPSFALGLFLCAVCLRFSLVAPL
jgi:hypothetical protein